MYPNSTSIKSYAKVNLGLKILELLPDNYHSIFTIMQEIDLYDNIEIHPNKSQKLTIQCEGSIEVPNNSKNLCMKAAQLIVNNYNINCGLNIALYKNIPTGSGLGGGSSNAAAVLCALNNMFELKVWLKRQF